MEVTRHPGHLLSLLAVMINREGVASLWKGKERHSFIIISQRKEEILMNLVASADWRKQIKTPPHSWASTCFALLCLSLKITKWTDIDHWISISLHAKISTFGLQNEDPDSLCNSTVYCLRIVFPFNNNNNNNKLHIIITFTHTLCNFICKLFNFGYTAKFSDETS